MHLAKPGLMGRQVADEMQVVKFLSFVLNFSKHHFLLNAASYIQLYFQKFKDCF